MRNNIKCHQCGSEEAKEYTNHYALKQRLEICFSCGYVRKITWFQMEMNGEIGKILDILDDEKEIADKIRLDSIRAVIEQ